MAKFYISSGNYQSIRTHKTAYGAALAAFQEMDGTITHLGDLTVVNEHGFHQQHKKDIMLSTLHLLEKANLAHLFVKNRS